MKINKQTFFTLLLIIGAVIIGLLVYWIFKSLGPPRDSSQQTPSTLAQLEKIFDEEVIYPTLDETGKNLFYFNISDKKDLAFYQFNLETKKEQKLSDHMSVPDRIIWSTNRDKTILKVINEKYIFEKTNSVFKDSSLEDKQETTWFYDLKTKKLNRLNLNIQSVNWFDNNRIIYNLYGPENNVNGIFIANADGENFEKIKDIDYSEGVGLGPLSSDEIYYYPIMYEFGGNNIYKVNIQTKQTSEIIGDESAGSAITTPSSNKIIYQIIHQKENKFTLMTMDKDGSNKKDLDIEGGINKVAFSAKGNFAIIAVRQQNQTTDTFYKININSDQKEELKYESQTTINAQKLFMSKDDKTLCFTSNNILYRLALP